MLLGLVLAGGAAATMVALMIDPSRMNRPCSASQALMSSKISVFRHVSPAQYGQPVKKIGFGAHCNN